MRISKFSALVAVMSFMATVSMGAVDLTFEPSDTNLLQFPTFSGSTAGITKGDGANTSTSYALDHNNIISPSDGTEGTTCYETVINITDATSAWPTGTTLVRITDFSDRHTLSAPASTGGFGGYFKYNGSAGDIQISLTVNEAPVGTGDNETYETAPWQVLSGSPNWQHFFWAFSTITSSADNWGQAIALGDGVYDGGGIGDAPLWEAVMVRPISGTTTSLTDIQLLIDDLYSGSAHSPSAVKDWVMFE